MRASNRLMDFEARGCQSGADNPAMLNALLDEGLPKSSSSHVVPSVPQSILAPAKAPISTCGNHGAFS
ncbi:unnamed protein product [Lampetra planeri]